MYEDSWKKAIELATLTFCLFAIAAFILFVLYNSAILRNLLIFSLIIVLVISSIIKLFWWLKGKINKDRNLKTNNKYKINKEWISIH